MSNEIKEILDDLGNDKNYKCDCNDGSYYLELSYREAHELKDCITNLQEENERLTQGVALLTSKIIDMTKAKEDYKSRNEKTIEYVKNDMPYLEEPDDDYENTHKMREYDKSILLNKLQGDDKDVKD